MSTIRTTTRTSFVLSVRPPTGSRSRVVARAASSAISCQDAWIPRQSERLGDAYVEGLVHSFIPV